VSQLLQQFLHATHPCAKHRQTCRPCYMRHL